MLTDEAIKEFETLQTTLARIHELAALRDCPILYALVADAYTAAAAIMRRAGEPTLIGSARATKPSIN